MQQTAVLTPHERPYTHHMLAYLCPFIQSVGYSGSCDDGVPRDVSACRNTGTLGGWAIGGQVSNIVGIIIAIVKDIPRILYQL